MRISDWSSDVCSSDLINFELPNVAEQYVHRIGRTARAGAEGVAISFVADDERQYLKQIEKMTRVRCEIVPLPENFAEAVRNLPKPAPVRKGGRPEGQRAHRSEEHTSELQSLMRI